MKDFKYTRLGYFLERTKRFFERMRMSDTEYRIMKGESKMYKDMLSTIKWETCSDYEDITDARGNIIQRLIKSKTSTVHVNVIEMLTKGGIVLDKGVKLDITSE